MRSVPDAAEHGDQRTLLMALRDRIAPLIDDPATHARDLNSLCFRMLEIIRDLDEHEQRHTRPSGPPRRRPHLWMEPNA